MQIFVSGIPYEANVAMIKEYFNQGENKSLSDKIIEVKLPLYQDSGKCRGFAHVEFRDQNSYDEGLKLSGKNLGSRYLELKPAAGRQSIATMDDSRKIADAMPEDCKVIYVKNLPYEMKEDDIGDRFRPFGEILEVRIGKNWTSGLSKGFCYIIYKEHISAKAALIKMNGRELKGFAGRNLKVDFDVKQKAKASYKTNMSDDGNLRFNKQIKKDEKGKHHRKENDKRKSSKIAKRY
jgi:nucleolin